MYKIGLTFCQAIDEINCKLEGNEERMDRTDEGIEEKLRDRDGKIADIKTIQRYLYNAICDLALQGRLLEGIAFGVSRISVGLPLLLM